MKCKSNPALTHQEAPTTLLSLVIKLFKKNIMALEDKFIFSKCSVFHKVVGLLIDNCVESGQKFKPVIYSVYTECVRFTHIQNFDCV